MVGLEHYLTVAAALFVIGIFGIFLNRKNVIVILMSIELMLLAVNINLVAFSSFSGDLVGQVFTMFVLTVAAAEAAIGLAILVVLLPQPRHHRRRRRQRDEGLTQMATIILFAPLVGALICGFGWRLIGEKAGQVITTGLLFLAGVAVAGIIFLTFDGDDAADRHPALDRKRHAWRPNGRSGWTG